MSQAFFTNGIRMGYWSSTRSGRSPRRSGRPARWTRWRGSTGRGRRRRSTLAGTRASRSRALSRTPPSAERAPYYDAPYYDGAPSAAFKPKQELDAAATPFS
ncbi:Os06g0480250 [Oryza sativa Japonica Group]|uniref:Os06g0480250 protein n=1 Tax=Oryza sativa subsp. japonica TaxID=39947 RepID=A0A0P0WX08_ORYSJ|nr:Os06g0480250 [Oryza sativa Japonica Group]